MNGSNICKSCNTELIEGEAFCGKCGKAINSDANNSYAKTIYVETPLAFASGLPEWNIEPPAVVVRRKARI